MLTPANPTLYSEAVNLSHTAAFKVTVLDGRGRPLQDIDFLGGSVAATLGSQVTRTAEILIDPALSPVSPQDLLFPNGNRLQIYRGIDYGCGVTDLLPVFHGRIFAVYDIPNGLTTIRAQDLSQAVRAAEFVVPTNSVPGASIQDEFQRLVSGALPSAQFGPSDTYAAPVGARTWDFDRSQAIDDMANAVGSFWWTRPDGRFVFRRVPWSVPQTPVLRLWDAQSRQSCELSGTLPADGLPFLYTAYSTRERSREQVANIITVSSELVDGTPPLVHTAADTDPSSPTWIGGNYGVQSRRVRTDVALTQAQVKLMAETTLARTKALVDTWSLQVVPDARIELGDCIEVRCQGITSVQVVAALTMPLSVDQPMQIGTRALLPELVR